MGLSNLFQWKSYQQSFEEINPGKSPLKHLSQGIFTTMKFFWKKESPNWFIFPIFWQKESLNSLQMVHGNSLMGN